MIDNDPYASNNPPDRPGRARPTPRPGGAAGRRHADHAPPTPHGASTTEVMLAGNWKTARMVAHYSAGATAERGAVAITNPLPINIKILKAMKR